MTTAQMTSSQTAGRDPLRCRLHLHRFGRKIFVPVHHTGEYPWEPWQHICAGLARRCQLCGHVRRTLLHRSCATKWGVKLPSQDEKITREDVQLACAILMKDLSG